jgi:hypothetical protein
MLTPFERSVAAYSLYLFAQFGPPRSGVAGGVLDILQRLAHGTGWSALVLAEALRERVGDTLPWVAPKPPPAAELDIQEGFAAPGEAALTDHEILEQGQPEINHLLTDHQGAHSIWFR